ncbi:MAG: twin-arginine translocase subunit TatC [Spirochaetaceae bacterium]|nr:twin-arginine translocase subunit TatC [Myxococcales bacterium]MCB9724027.1 twin-arginine translocase subunit TatC [Spirochaetaceae bacterium]HPG24969.1 twin-arginine translocase subunit TatC [Myxococcota bacterium]
MDERTLPITEHLAELRMRIAWIAGSITLGALLSFNYAEQIFGFLLEPATEALAAKGSKLQAIAPAEIFFTYVKCAILAGFVLTLPVTFWQIWAFVAPGLYDNERKAILPFVVCSSALFAGGAIFGYALVFPVVFQFFNSWDNEWVVSAWTMREVFSLTTRLFLAFGVAFELPLFVFFLAITGIVSAKQLFRGTPYAVLVMFILGAILTPPDVVSQVMLALPMIVLYLSGAAVAWVFDPQRRAEREAARAAKQAGSAVAKRDG